MKHLVSILFALVSINAHAAPGAETLLGTHRLDMGKPGNSLEIVLECTTESNCTFTSTSTSGDTPYRDKQILNNVRPVENLIYATNALKYVIEHQTESPRFKDAVEALDRLRPMLQSNPGISKCWDLNYPTPEYMLACTFDDHTASVTTKSAPIFLFATLMANCNDVFCRYLIYPMVRVR